MLFLGGISLLLYGFAIKSESENLLKDLTALKVGTSTDADVQFLRQKHKLFLVSTSCNDGICQTLFRVKNTWLSKLRFEPLASFDAWAVIKEGRVASIHASLLRYMPIFPTFDASGGMVSEYDEYPKPQAHFYATSYSFPTPVGKPYLRVVLDPHATQIQRQRAFHFSFRCLVKPGGGCNLPCDYLPQAWQDWNSSLLNSPYPLPKDAFDKSYPNSPRCKSY